MFVLILTACTWQPTPIGLDGGPPIHPGVPVLPDRLDDDGSAVQSAQTELKRQDGTLLGAVVFEASDGGLRITGDLEGLRPNAVHAVHVHEGARCGTDFEAAGGHFNPGGDPHGAPGPQSHAGDLGNFTTDADGTASLDLVSADLGLDGDSSAVARTLVVHEGADDMTTQPSGAAGGRLACGSIHRAMKTPVAPAL